MKSKRIPALLLSLCLCLWLLPAGGARAASLDGAGTEENPYKIASAADWAALAVLAQADKTAGEYFLQTADFTTELMVGSKDHPFRGNYDGWGHTLTFNAASAPEDCAPFQYIQNAVISHLRTAGTIVTGRKFAAGLAADILGSCTIEDCRSEITIDSTVKGDGTHGGLVGVCAADSKTEITGCVFSGRLLGPDTIYCGGFVGFNKGALTLTDCVFAPAELNLAGSSQNFARAYDTTKPALNRCYYVGSGLNDQGERIYSVTAGADLALTPPGTEEPKQTYAAVGYRIWDNFAMLGNTLLNFRQLALTLDLTYTGPLGKDYVLKLELSGGTNVSCTPTGPNTFTLSLITPDKDLQIGIRTVIAPDAYYADPLDREDPLKTVKDIPVIAGDLTELTEEWYLAYGSKTLSDRLRVSGNVNLILADGAELTAPFGVDVPKGSTLTIWGQSGAYAVPGEGITTLGTGALIASTGSDQAAAIGSGKNQAAGTIVINGGAVTAKGNWGAGIGSGDVGTCGSVIIHEGCVIASGNNGSAGIGGGAYTDGGAVTITGGYVKATGSSYDGTYSGVTWSQATPGIGPGRPRPNGEHLYPGTVVITGGTVVAVAGTPDTTRQKVYSAQAIGVNLADESEVTAESLALGAVRAYAPNGVKTPAAAADRRKACRDTTSVRIEACRDHPVDNEGLCRYCGGLPYHDPTDEKWPEKACIVFTEVTGSTTSFSGGWYAVRSRSNVKISARIRFSGETHLILADGAKLEAADGITVAESGSLTIWSQTEGTGELTSKTGTSANAGIGGSSGTAGQVTINGGIISAAGGEDAAGIGGGKGGSGTVTVNGGTVTANGGSSGAGIGGGISGSGTVTVNGGTITAIGGKNAAGIGGGKSGSGTVKVNGGSVTAAAGEQAGAMGSGSGGGTGSVGVYSGARVMAGKDEGSALFSLRAYRNDACAGNRWARIEPCHPHANAGGACRWCGAKGGLAVTRNGDTLEVKCSLPEEAQVTVTVACFDASGRFLLCAVKDAGTRKDFQFTASAPQSAGTWKIFITDEKGRSLAEAWEEPAADR